MVWYFIKYHGTNNYCDTYLGNPSPVILAGSVTYIHMYNLTHDAHLYTCTCAHLLMYTHTIASKPLYTQANANTHLYTYI